MGGHNCRHLARRKGKLEKALEVEAGEGSRVPGGEAGIEPVAKGYYYRVRPQEMHLRQVALRAVGREAWRAGGRVRKGLRCRV